MPLFKSKDETPKDGGVITQSPAGPVLHNLFESPFDVSELPKHRLGNEAMPGGVVYQAVKDMLQFDRNPRLNLGSFVTTYMSQEANDLILETLNLNFADVEVYASSGEIEKRCVHIIADIWNLPDPKSAHGCSTVGSSEACLLGGLNMKKRWQTARRLKGLNTDKPNIVLAYSNQIVWSKFAAYFDVEARHATLEEGQFVMTPESLRTIVDENTIGIVAIFGSTYTGGFEDVKGMGKVLDEIQREKGWDIPIHVDAASGGFVAPFIAPEIEWDFRVPRVLSISTSGHKYGLVYPGVGWLVYRSKEIMDPSLAFHIAYLGSDQETLTFNFSRPACFVVAQYFQLVRLGREGYTQIVHNMRHVACKLAEELEAMGRFRLLNDPRLGPCVPLVAWTLKEVDGKKPKFSEYDLADKLKEWGWTIPAYAMPPNVQSITCMRAVVRVDMSISTAEILVDHIRQALVYLDAHFRFITPEQHIQASEEVHGTKRTKPHEHAFNLSMHLPGHLHGIHHHESKQHIPC